LSENVYLGVVPISKIENELVMESNSEVVEYAVKMQQLDENGFLDKLLEKGKIEPKDLDRIVEVLGSFYLDQKPSEEIAEGGRIERIRDPVLENFDQTEGFVGDLISDYTFRAIQVFNEQFFCRYTPILNHRRTAGRILNCHGDLRLEHIHLTTDDMNIFDCVEFNKRFRYIDIANDVAFTAMDLDFRGRADLSCYFVEQMSEYLEDSGMMPLLDFYKCYRAYVRAKVCSLKSVEPEVTQQQKEKSRSDAIRLYQLALKYAVCGSEPMVIIIMGRIGTGKSTVAGELSLALGCEYLDSDIVRKDLAGVDLTAHPDENTRNELYSDKMTDRTYEELARQSVKQAREFKSCVIDATFGSYKRRLALRNTLKSHRIRYRFIELTASDDAIKRRLFERQDSKNEVSDARLENFEMLNDNYHRPDARELTHHAIINTEQNLQDTMFDILIGTLRMTELKQVEYS
jgi:aminoglycoside phosphotransferase family enzyme/predicted kinase